MEAHEKFMNLALEEARQSLTENEFPVGCVLVFGDRVVGRGRRQNSRLQNAFELDHAEIKAIHDLEEHYPHLDRRKIVAYTTMEPCLMCFTTLLLNNITRIVYAYEDVMGGGTNLPLLELKPLYRNIQYSITPKILRAKSLALMKDYFANPANTYWQQSLLAQYTLAQD